MTDDDQPECINGLGENAAECRGAVEYRPSLTGTGTPIARCDFHWDQRLQFEEGHRVNYPDSSTPPAWFDPSYAGECWDDDY
jgi:hypothetical protein